MDSSPTWSLFVFVGQFADMVRSATSAIAVASVAAVALASKVDIRATDACVAIANQTWVAPSAVRACYQSFKVNATEK
jgi:hypothetical protein